MYKKALLLANELADISQSLILNYFRKNVEVENKGDSSPVTIADKEAERLMREKILEVFPSHGIIGEEFGNHNETSEFVWVLDPIDGTKSFISGLPLFGTLIALLHNNKPVVGVINQPYTKERWTGVMNEPSLFNGSVVKTRACESLSQATLCSTGGRLMFDNPKDKSAFSALSTQVQTTRLSTDCYAYGLLSMGFVDIVCEAKMKLYDYAALAPIVLGAGGFMSDWQGLDLFDKNNKNCAGHVLALGDKTLLPFVIEALDV